MDRKLFTFVLAVVFMVTLAVTTLVSIQVEAGSVNCHECSYCPGYQWVPEYKDGHYDYDLDTCYVHVCIPPGGCPPLP